MKATRQVPIDKHLKHMRLWLFPRRRQWREWSLPSKLTAVGTAVSTASLVLAIATLGLTAKAYTLLARLVQRPSACQRLAAGQSRYYEAEVADLTGDAAVDSEHGGYSGNGFVSGYGIGRPGTGTTFRVEAPASGRYRADLCYANANGSQRRLSIYVNSERVKRTWLPNASRWNIWLTKTELLQLKSGINTVSYRMDADDNGAVNIDFLRIAPE